MSKPICRYCAAGVQLFKHCGNLSAGTVLQGCSCLSGVKPICRHCVAGVQLFKCCQTYLSALCCRGAAVKTVSQLSAGTVLQRCSCLSGVATYLQALCCICAAVLAVSQPICRHFATGVQLFKQCPNLPACTVLQGCSCLSGVKTYLPALCCRGEAVQVVSKPTCRHCAAGVHLFKWCQNLSAGTVLQRCSCLSGVKTYLPALCCRGAAV